MGLSPSKDSFQTVVPVNIVDEESYKTTDQYATQSKRKFIRVEDNLCWNYSNQNIELIFKQFKLKLFMYISCLIYVHRNDTKTE